MLHSCLYIGNSYELEMPNIFLNQLTEYCWSNCFENIMNGYNHVLNVYASNSEIF